VRVGRIQRFQAIGLQLPVVWVASSTLYSDIQAS
jgi:hypothetical protein